MTLPQLAGWLLTKRIEKGKQGKLLLQTEIDRSCQTKVSVPVNTELILYLSDKSLDTISYLYIE